MEELNHWDTQDVFSLDDAAALVVGVDPLRADLSDIETRRIQMVRTFLAEQHRSQIEKEIRSLMKQQPQSVDAVVHRPALISVEAMREITKIRSMLVGADSLEKLLAGTPTKTFSTNAIRHAKEEQKKAKSRGHLDWVRQISDMPARFHRTTLEHWLDFQGVRSNYKFERPAIYIDELDPRGWSNDPPSDAGDSKVTRLSRPAVETAFKGVKFGVWRGLWSREDENGLGEARIASDSPNRKPLYDAQKIVDWAVMRGTIGRADATARILGTAETTSSRGKASSWHPG